MEIVDPKLESSMKKHGNFFAWFVPASSSPIGQRHESAKRLREREKKEFTNG